MPAPNDLNANLPLDPLVQSSSDPLDVSGTYSDNYGVTFTLFQNGSQAWAIRRFSSITEQVTGTVSGNVMTGTFLNSDGGNGNFTWTFASDASSFSGAFGLGTNTPTQGWTGSRQPGVSIQLTPSSAVMATGGVQSFQAFVAGSSNKSVSWSATGGSVDGSGVFTAPTGSGGIYTVTATSGADTTKSASATIAASPSGFIDISGTYSDSYGRVFTLFQNGPQVWGVREGYPFQATLTGYTLAGIEKNLDGSTNLNFVWTFAPDGNSYTGLWNTGTATPINGWSGTRQPGVSVQVAPASAILMTGGVQNLQSWVAGSYNKAVTWQSNSGTVTGEGVFTAPAAPGGVSTITATSAADTTKSASATIAASPSGFIDISGTYSDSYGRVFTLFQNGPQVWGIREGYPFQATLTGYTLTGVEKNTDGTIALNFVWTFAPDGNAYTGVWNPGTATPTTGWSGTRQPGVSVQVVPPAAILMTGASQSLQSWVAGSYNKAVTWHSNGGTVTGEGVFTAPAAPGGVSTITATSAADTNKSASATIAASPSGFIDISGTYSDSYGRVFTLFQNGPQVWGVREGYPFQATLTGYTLTGIEKNLDGSTNLNFVWTFAPDGNSYSGFWNTGTATPINGWSGTRQPGVSVQLTPGTAYLEPTWSMNIQGYVAGIYDKRLTWTAPDPDGGTVTAGGLYTAPPAIGVYHVSAASVVSPSSSATSTITAAVQNLEVLPAWARVKPGLSASFQARVQGVQTDAVTWGIQEGAAGGSIDTSGYYTAPANSGTYHVVATSLYDGSVKAIVEVQVATGSPVSVDITPYVSQLSQGGTQQFSATVGNAQNTGVTWTTTGGTISAAGLYTAPSTYGNYTVTATSLEDPSASDTANVVVSSGTGTDKTFTYDLNGNLTSDGTRTFEWDAENRLVAVVKGTHRSEFGYDGFGHRVEIHEFDADANGNWVPSTDTKYVWEGAQILESRTADGGTSLQRYYAQGFMDADGTALYYTRDHLGSTRELADAQGAIRARYDYDPYGRMTKISGDKDSPFLYTGHLWHAYSGLYLTLNREYDANLGRWISRDPFTNTTRLLLPGGGGRLSGLRVSKIISAFDAEGLQDGPDLYAYTGNNPINKIDPFGLQGVTSCDAAIMQCMRLPSFAMRAKCLNELLGLYEDSGDVPKALKEAVSKANDALKQAIDHVFSGGRGHDFGSLLEQFGGDKMQAYEALENATVKAAQGLGNGPFEVTIEVNGQSISATGNITNGVVRFGNAFIR